MNAVSLYVNAGQWLGLVGESGSGKTMPLLAITGLLPANARVSAEATLVFESSAINQPERRTRIAPRLNARESYGPRQSPALSTGQLFSLAGGLLPSSRSFEIERL